MKGFHKKMVGWTLVIMVMIAGCAGNQAKDSGVNSEGVSSSIQSYQLGPNDLLRITVFDEPDLTTETEVSGHGTIKFPLLGEILVRGLTVKEAEETLTQNLKAGYLNYPKVTVSIVRYRNFYVSGEARNPGAFPYQEGLTVLKAITLAGGWTDKAAKGDTKVLRQVNGEEQMVSVELEETIQPDDIIIIPESFF